MTIRQESRGKFEKQGHCLTLHHLQLDNMPQEEKNEIVEWLAEKEHETEHLEQKRFRQTMMVAVFAALGAWVAAWPVLKSWCMN
ncbi:MAG: hypothetical protein ACREDV_06445 [Methylocella sp.]